MKTSSVASKIKLRLQHLWTGRTGPRTEQLSDFYVDYLRYATPGMCTPGNVYLFDQVIRDLQSPLPILEIGSWCGQSANILTYLLKKYNKPNLLFTCDGWQYESDQRPEKMGSSEYTFDEYYEFVRHTYIRNTNFFSRGRLPHSIHLVSDDFFAAWRTGQQVTDVFGRATQLGGEFSFCFIDGDHSDPACSRDFENCNAHLASDGVILFDDSSEHGGWPDVHRLAKRVAASKQYRLLAQNPNYLVRKM